MNLALDSTAAAYPQNQKTKNWEINFGDMLLRPRRKKRDFPEKRVINPSGHHGRAISDVTSVLLYGLNVKVTRKLDRMVASKFPFEASTLSEFTACLQFLPLEWNGMLDELE